MANFYLIKYKDNEGNIQTLIDKERSCVGIESLIHDMKKELQIYNKVGYPTFAIEQINENQFNYLKKMGYYALGE